MRVVSCRSGHLEATLAVLRHKRHAEGTLPHELSAAKEMVERYEDSLVFWIAMTGMDWGAGLR